MSDAKIRAALRPFRKRMTIGRAYTEAAEALGIERLEVVNAYLRATNRRASGAMSLQEIEFVLKNGAAASLRAKWDKKCAQPSAPS
jgi:hypothetical protein